MSLSDPIGDMLTRVRNAQAARRESCQVPYAKHVLAICTLLQREGSLADVATSGEGTSRTITLTFKHDRPRLCLKRVSKPGRRVYLPISHLKPVLQGYGFAILSTNQGLLTDQEARTKKVGGEVLCTVS